MSDRKPEIILNQNGPVAYPADRITEACAVVWEQVKTRRWRTLIVYVHGRAAGTGKDREPHESFVKDRVIDELESTHQAGVVMLHWPHSALLNGFPKEDAVAAAPLLVSLLRALASARPAGLVDIPVIVLTHSMGGIVLGEAVRADRAAFDHVHTVVTSASGASLKNSAEWLAKLATGPKVYVVRNEKDSVLKLVFPVHRPFLGLGTAKDLHEAGTAAGVFYLDVTNQGVKHPYFYAKDERDTGRARLRDAFYGPLYRGEALEPSHFEAVLPHNASIHRLKT